MLVICAFVNKMLERKYSQPITIMGWLILCILDEIIVLGLNNKYLNLITYVGFILVLFKMIYKGDLKTKVITIVYIGMYGVLSEFVVYICMSLITEIKNDMYLLTSAISKVIFSLVIRITIVLKRTEDSVALTKEIWLCVFVIPMGTSIASIVQYHINGGFYNTYLEVLFYILFIVVNYFSFVMFDSMQHYVVVCNERQVLKKETEYYYMQCKNVQNMWESMRNIKHDISNQYLCEKIMLQKGEYTVLEQQYDDMIEMLEFRDIYSKTGNINVDSIINFKVSQIIKIGGQVDVDISVPKDIKLDGKDMVIVIGNLLDNAIEAIEKSEEKKVGVYIKYYHPNLLIKINNSYGIAPQISNKNEYLSTKDDKSVHGIGLKSVKSVLKKYNGKINITEEKNVFTVRVHMCLV